MNKITEVLSYFPPQLSAVFEVMDSALPERINEIRLHRNGWAVIVIKNTSYFFDYNGDIYDSPDNHCVFTDSDMFDEVFMSFCSYSVYSNMDSLINGYITLKCGARVGVASGAVYDGRELSAVKDASSLNIRIPREVKGCADGVLNFLYISSFPSIIVAGLPNSGKTTFLRDLARSLSGGFNNRYRKVCIVDERNELAAVSNGVASADVGANTDVLTSFNKARGIEIATRTLSPELIICDEIGTDEEAESVLYAFSSGIRFALSVHISSRRDLLYKPLIRKLLTTGEFSYIVLLEGYSYKYEIIDCAEVIDEIRRNTFSDSVDYCNRNAFIT